MIQDVEGQSDEGHEEKRLLTAPQLPQVFVSPGMAELHLGQVE